MEMTLRAARAMGWSCMVLRIMVWMVLSNLAAVAADFTVDVENVRGSKGKVRALLFSSATGFPDGVDQASARVDVDAAKGHVRLTFRDVKPGRYAIAVLHDEDQDGKVSSSMFGMPKEGVGVSGPLGNSRPVFSKCLVEVKPGGKLGIRMKYW